MHRALVPALAISALFLAPPLDAHAEAGSATLPGLALLDFNYVDTSGETRDQTAEHQKRLDTFMLALRQDIAASKKYRMVVPTCRPIPCEVGQSALTELQEAARQPPLRRGTQALPYQQHLVPAPDGDDVSEGEGRLREPGGQAVQAKPGCG